MSDELGKIQINEDVIATIASLAAVEVDGIVSIAGGKSLSEVWGSGKLKKGVGVSTDEAGNFTVINLEVNVEYGIDVYKAAHNLQRAVKDAVENMTGLRVKAVDVKVAGIVLGEEPRRISTARKPDPAGKPVMAEN